jgi:hypothetical protein
MSPAVEIEAVPDKAGSATLNILLTVPLERLKRPEVVVSCTKIVGSATPSGGSEPLRWIE